MKFESAIKKNLWILFQKYNFIRKIEPFHLRMKHNIVKIALTVYLTVPHLITFILNGSLQKIVQRGEVTAPRRPIDIRDWSSYSIFINGAQTIDCYVGCVAPCCSNQMSSMSSSSIFGNRNSLSMAI